MSDTSERDTHDEPVGAFTGGPGDMAEDLAPQDAPQAYAEEYVDDAPSQLATAESEYLDESAAAPEYAPPTAPAASPRWVMAPEHPINIRHGQVYEADEEQDFSFRRTLVVAITAVAIFLVMGVFYLFQGVLIPFALAFLLAYILKPMVNMFHEFTGRRGVAVGMTVGVLTIFGLGIGTQLLPLMARQSTDMLLQLNKVWTDVRDSTKIKDLNRTTIPPQGAVAFGKSDIGWREFVTAWSDYLQSKQVQRDEAIARMRSSLHNTGLGGFFDNTVLFIENRPFNDMINRAGKAIFTNGWAALWFVALTTGSVGLALVIVCYIILLIRDFPNFSGAWQSFIPPRYRGPVAEFFEEYDATMRQHLCRQTIAAIVLAVVFSVGLTIAKIPMAVPIGVAIAVMSMIPFLKLAALPPVLLLGAFHAFNQQVEMTPILLSTLAVFVVAQLISELLLKPFVIRRVPSPERMAILLCTFLLWKILGVLGILLAIPLTCLAIAWYRVQSRKYTAESIRLAAA